jgi:hypothetical protein
LPELGEWEANFEVENTVSQDSKYMWFKSKFNFLGNDERDISSTKLRLKLVLL